MSNHEDIIKKYDKSIVKITTHDGLNIGTGFIVTDDGVICTCYHVVGDKDTKELYDNIQVYFPKTEQTVSASFLLKDDNKEPYADAINDISFLQISKQDQDQLKNNGQELIPLPLSESVIFGHRLISRGFRKEDEFPHGLGSSGEIRVITNYRIDTDVIIPIVQLYVSDIEGGMSGSPVLDRDTNKVIGMIDRIYDKEEEKKDPNLVMAIPVESLVKIYRDLANKNPGLVLINQFLEQVGLIDSSIYQNFDDLYVKPKIYSKILQKLEDKKCIFVIGIPEYGKTFTAIKLMWEKWKRLKLNCYFPRNDEEKNEILTDVLKNDERYKNSIICLDDPTGETNYKENPIFQSNIVRVINKLRSLNSYLLITMRDNIYQETLNDIIGESDESGELQYYTIRLEFGDSSYDFKQREEILLGWANKMKCRWLDDEELRNMVFIEIENERLPTPFNIYDFCLDTGQNGLNYNIKNKDDLKQLIKKYSQQTAKIFTIDLMKIKKEKDGDTNILFACFPFISDEFRTPFVQRKFNQLIEPRNDIYNYKQSVFNNATNTFQGRINTSKYIRFVHPSLSESLHFLLKKNNQEIEFQDIFAKVLLLLSKDLTSSKNIIDFILKNYDLFINKNVKDLLNNILACQDLRWNALKLIIHYLENLPETIIERLFEIKKEDSIYEPLLLDILTKFDKLPERYKENLFEIIIEKASYDSIFASKVLYSLKDKLYRYSPSAKECLFETLIKYSSNNQKFALQVINTFYFELHHDELDSIKKKLMAISPNYMNILHIARDISYSIISNYSSYNKLPNSVKWKVVDNWIKEIEKNQNEEVAQSILMSMRGNYDKLPTQIKDKLVKIYLTKIDEKIINFKFLIYIIDIFQHLSSSNKGEVITILMNYINDNNMIDNLVLARGLENVHLFPKVLQERLIKKISSMELLDDTISPSISNSYDNIPVQFREELLNALMKRGQYTGIYSQDIFRSLVNHYDQLPKSIKNQIVKMINNDEYSSIFSFTNLARNYNKFPKSIKNQIVKMINNNKLLNNDKYWIRHNFDEISEPLREKLFEIMKDNSEIIIRDDGLFPTDLDKLPEAIRERLINILLKHLEENKSSVAMDMFPFIFEQYHQLQEPLKDKLIEYFLRIVGSNGYVAEKISFALAYYTNLDKFSEPFKDKLIESLLKYINNNETLTIDLFKVILNNFHKISALSRDKLIESLIKSLDRNEHIAKGILRYSSPIELVKANLPPSLKDKLIESLLKYANKNENIALILYGYAISVKFENLSMSQREKISNVVINHIDNNEKFAESMASMVSPGYEVRPAKFESTVNYELPQPFVEKLVKSLLKHAHSNKILATWLVHIINCYEIPSKLSIILIELSNTKFEEIHLSIAFFLIANYYEVDTNTLDTLIKNNNILKIMYRNRDVLDEFLRSKINSYIK